MVKWESRSAAARGNPPWALVARGLYEMRGDTPWVQSLPGLHLLQD